MQEAEAALNSLDKASLGELKSFGSPASEIVQVLAACMVLCASGGNIPKDLRWAPMWLGWEAPSKTEFGGSHRLSAEGSQPAVVLRNRCMPAAAAQLSLQVADTGVAFLHFHPPLQLERGQEVHGQRGRLPQVTAQL